MDHGDLLGANESCCIQSHKPDTTGSQYVCGICILYSINFHTHHCLPHPLVAAPLAPRCHPELGLNSEEGPFRYDPIALCLITHTLLRCLSVSSPPGSLVCTEALRRHTNTIPSLASPCSSCGYLKTSTETGPYIYHVNQLLYAPPGCASIRRMRNDGPCIIRCIRNYRDLRPPPPRLNSPDIKTACR